VVEQEAQSLTHPDPKRARVFVLLGALYCFHLASEGILITFWPYHLGALGLDEGDLGVIFSVRTLIGVVAQPALASLSDRLGKPRRFLAWAVGLAFVVMLGAPFAVGFASMAALFWVQAVPRNAIGPLIDAVSLQSAGAGGYARVRLWGSVGYGAAVAGFGWLTLGWTYPSAGAFALPMYLCLAAVAVLSGVLLPRDEGVVEPRRAGQASEGAWALLKTPGLAAFLAGNALHWATLMCFNVYQSLHAKALGLDSWVAGMCVTVGVLAEIAAFAWLGARVAAQPPKWLWWSMPPTALRWVGMALTADAYSLVAWQVVHFASFGVWWTAALAQLVRFAPEGRRATLQGVFAASVLGVGGSAGVWVGGQLVKHADTHALLWAMVGMETLAMLVLAVSWRRWVDPRPVSI
jgi:PPP family 3-phenylpropionic acid transporter